MQVRNQLSTHKNKIMIIEDDTQIARFMELELGCEGYDVMVRHNGLEGLMAIRECNPDLIILDRMLPQLDGVEICARLRQSSDVPILMLTAKADFRDRVQGLDAGANDYVTKPFNLNELLARVRVQLRHCTANKHQALHVADLSLNPGTREVHRGHNLIHLAPKEFDVLLILMKQAGQVVSRIHLLEGVWGANFEGYDNVLDVCIHSLRDKIEMNGQPKLLHTIRRIGYVLRECS